MMENYLSARITKGRSVLIERDKSKDRVASNYRPVSCLLLIWKLMTRGMAQELFWFLEIANMIQEKQKG